MRAYLNQQPVPPARIAPAPRLVADDVRQARRQACGRCQWRAERQGRAWCDQPDRACAKLNPQFAVETCPAGRWPPAPPKDPPERR
jgi:hypothetical protein